ncbi:hypothetical protein O5O45_13870 [Hahella aquimaris]|uniref:hypothetical protein n=1 Tax=Hahella sp. HNIBRBA332 TaxID=3015983 RepID=UPI00273B3D92|nr:hypothetical protein [Hahella sp. HNIBRBA332]WLQ17002.1 hypothetical protein O5O45_13870 [Hahella sp. HNIBRBA332]
MSLFLNSMLLRASRMIRPCIFVLASLLAFPFSVCAQTVFSWRHDGVVVNQGQTLQTELQNAYTGFETDEGLYLAGFKIDRKGENFPFVVFISRNLERVNSWPLETMASQFFEYQQKLYVLDVEGKAFQFDGTDWKPSGLTFKPDSIIISAGENLIACSPAPLTKAATGTGSCYSLFKQWDVEANWRAVSPKICDGSLILQDSKSSSTHFLVIEVTSGKLLNSNASFQEVAAFCTGG